MEILGWLLLGLIAGALAKLIYPGRQGGGIFATILLGILGAFLGGWVAQALRLALPSLVTAVIGAVILIFLWGLVARRTA